MSGPGDVKSGQSVRNNPDGTQHWTYWWTEGDGITHRESYNVDRDGNVTDYHYGQRLGDTEIHYNYHTESWDVK